MIENFESVRNYIKLPLFLQQGDSVAIISPSGAIKPENVNSAIEILQSWGLHVVTGQNIYKQSGVFAGTDSERSADFQNMIDNANIKAIFCSRGGYGAIRIVEKLDFSNFQQNPKWIIGFSDITVFHAKLCSIHIASIHGAMPKNFTSITKDSLDSLKKTIFGKNISYTFKTSHCNKLGKATGQLVGGNLSMLYSMRGLDFEYDYSNKILFIEDLNEYFYHIDRIMQNLYLSGILAKLSGLIVGGMSNMKNGIDVYESSIEAIILDCVKEYNYPVCFNFPSGHDSENFALVIGNEYELRVEKNECILENKV